MDSLEALKSYDTNISLHILDYIGWPDQICKTLVKLGNRVRQKHEPKEQVRNQVVRLIYGTFESEECYNVDQKVVHRIFLRNKCLRSDFGFELIREMIHVLPLFKKQTLVIHLPQCQLSDLITYHMPWIITNVMNISQDLDDMDWYQQRNIPGRLVISERFPNRFNLLVPTYQITEVYNASQFTWVFKELRALKKYNCITSVHGADKYVFRWQISRNNIGVLTFSNIIEKMLHDGNFRQCLKELGDVVFEMWYVDPDNSVCTLIRQTLAGMNVNDKRLLNEVCTFV